MHFWIPMSVQSVSSPWRTQMDIQPKILQMQLACLQPLRGAKVLQSEVCGFSLCLNSPTSYKIVQRQRTKETYRWWIRRKEGCSRDRNRWRLRERKPTWLTRCSPPCWRGISCAPASSSWSYQKDDPLSCLSHQTRTLWSENRVPLCAIQRVCESESSLLSGVRFEDWY